MLKLDRTITAKEIARAVEGHLTGDPRTPVRGIESLTWAQPDEITFLSRPALVPHWPASRAGALLLTRGIALGSAADERTVIEVADAERAASAVLQLFARPEHVPAEGVHATAFVDPRAQLGPGVRIGPMATVGAECRIGAGTVLHAGAHVYARSVIGAACVLHAGVVLREGVSIGDRVTLHPGVVIGTDGFGYRPDASGRGLAKVPHIGTVRIEDDVEIGAGSCVDRAKFGATVIGQGTKIDNLCQIGHNCRIGRCCVIAALAGIAGSVEFGDGVMVGGASHFADHVKVGSGAKIGGASGVISDVPAGAVWLGLPAGPAKETLRHWASVRKLPVLLATLRRTFPRGE